VSRHYSCQWAEHGRDNYANEDSSKEAMHKEIYQNIFGQVTAQETASLMSRVW